MQGSLAVGKTIMKHRRWGWTLGLTLLAGGCDFGSHLTTPAPGLEIKLLFSSALSEFCNQMVPQFNQQNPQLADGTRFHINCTTLGTGDVVNQVVHLAQQWQQGQIKAEDPQFPTLISLDGDIYYSQLIYRMDQLFPGKNYIPAITEAPLIAFSPMVFMVPSEVADALKNVDSVYRKILPATTFQDIDPKAPPENFLCPNCPYPLQFWVANPGDPICRSFWQTSRTTDCKRRTNLSPPGKDHPGESDPLWHFHLQLGTGYGQIRPVLGIHRIGL